MSCSYIRNSSHAYNYSIFRPSPPKELVHRIIDFLKETIPPPFTNAVDIGCGSGQSTQVLAPFFKSIVGVDNSESQINHALKRNTFQHITYKVGSSDYLEFEENSVQLVTAGQCAHWFEIPKFFVQAEKVLQQGGVLALYCYNVPELKYKNADLKPCVNKFFFTTMRDYILPNSIMVDEYSYDCEPFRKFPFSSENSLMEKFTLEVKDTSVADLIGYVSTRSSYQNFKQQKGDELAEEVLVNLRNEIMEATGSDLTQEETKIDLKFPFSLVLGRKD